MLHLKIITVTFYTKILTIVIKQKITMEWRFTQAVISEKMTSDAAAEEIYWTPPQAEKIGRNPQPIEHSFETQMKRCSGSEVCMMCYEPY